MDTKHVNPEPFAILMAIMRQLTKAQIYYEINAHREGAISIDATVPGERWEIDVLEDGDVDFERFVSNGHIYEREDLDLHIAKWRKIEEENSK